MAVARRVALLSLDGLNYSDYETLTTMLPKSQPLLNAHKQVRLSPQPVVAAEPLWAELMTGVPWYRSGIFAYAKPTQSLNQTRVVSEKDLNAPLINAAASTEVVVNVPILSDNKRRFWLADGARPSPKVVSPPSLAGQDRFCDYIPRASASIIEGVGKFGSNAVARYLENEKVRLGLAQELIITNPCAVNFIRFTIFDALGHLAGPGFLAARDSILYTVLRPFLTDLDEFIYLLLSTFDHIVIVSCYSHSQCSANIQLNDGLYRAGLLRYAQPDEASRRRAEAIAALAEIDDLEQQQMITATYSDKNRIQRPFDCAATIAASPVSGCIYINSKERFSDGIVEDCDLPAVRAHVREILDRYLIGLIASEYRIYEAGDLFAGDDTNVPSSFPDLIVAAAGVEFNNGYNTRLQTYDVPRSMHSGEGFVWATSASSAVQMFPRDVSVMLQNAIS